VIVKVYEADKEDVDRAVKAARAAFPMWSKTPGTARRDLMLK
jgi:acyl-CoA reductase-like NAD-dependent aldehyde dehydrogenase